MNETRWLACDDPRRMLDWLTSQPGDSAPHHDPLRPEVSARKLRLFACACCRDQWGLLTEEGKSQVEFAEFVTDTPSTASAPFASLLDWWANGRRAAGHKVTKRQSGPGFWSLGNVATAAAVNTATSVQKVAKAFAKINALDDEVETGAAYASCALGQANLLRDLIGNPWRRVHLCGEPHPGNNVAPDLHCSTCRDIVAWNERTVVNLAEVIYTDRRWEEMPILADALEEAGLPEDVESLCPSCSPHHTDRENPFGVGPGYRPERDPASGRHEGGWTNCKTCNSGGRRQIRAGVVLSPHPILVHLRGPRLHARGCWVVDMLLGKE